MTILRQNISFLHAADLHLDSPFLGLAQSPDHVFTEARQSTFHALNNLTTLAIEKNVDFVLLVGDIFDESVQSLKAQVSLRQAFERLHAYNIRVYMSYGNHDYVQRRVHQVTYPDNVFIFPNEQITVFNFPDDNDPLVAIYGFSYEQRNITERKVDEYQRQHSSIPFHIGLLHGSLYGHSSHASYAPFTLSDLTAKHFDYWALGHIHKRQILHEDPPIVYPGNIQGRHHLESGAKGCYYVELSKAECELSFVPLHAIEFVSLQLDVLTCETIFDLEKLLEQTLANYTNQSTPLLINLHLIGSEILFDWEQQDHLQEIIDWLNDQYLQANHWMYIYHVTTAMQRTNFQQASLDSEHFFQALNTQFANDSITPFLKQLYEHPQAKKYLQRLTDAEEKMIKEKAQQLLMSELLRPKR